MDLPGRDATRQSRKSEHLNAVVALGDHPARGGFEDFRLVHNCLPEVSLDQVDLTTEICGLKLKAPIYINAVTGGSPEVGEVNAKLARVARKLGLALAVGSQRAGIDDPAVAGTYRVARENYPDGIIMANVSAGTPPEKALKAIEMVRADILQVHLNPAQELVMTEGDRDFRGWLRNIARLVASMPVPILVKEVGFGIAAEQARRLAEVGVRAVDVSGTGGTNFASIEAHRSGRSLAGDLVDWGVPTPVSLVECSSVPGLQLVASGGIRSGTDILKSLALGASAAAVAGPLVRALSGDGEPGAEKLVTGWLADLRVGMALAGQTSVLGLRRCPMVITGFAAGWLSARGFDPVKLGNLR